MKVEETVKNSYIHMHDYKRRRQRLAYTCLLVHIYSQCIHMENSRLPVELTEPKRIFTFILKLLKALCPLADSFPVRSNFQ